MKIRRAELLVNGVVLSTYLVFLWAIATYNLDWILYGIAAIFVLLLLVKV